MGRKGWMLWVMVGWAVPGCSLFGDCGNYDILGDKGDEACGGPFGSWGYLGGNTRIFFSTEDPGDIALWGGSWQASFDAALLVEGEVIEASNGRALCSRFEDPASSLYLTSYTSDFEIKVVADKGVIEDDIVGDTRRVVFDWWVSCDDLEMSASGRDAIDLDMGGLPPGLAAL